MSNKRKVQDRWLRKQAREYIDGLNGRQLAALLIELDRTDVEIPPPDELPVYLWDRFRNWIADKLEGKK